MIAHYQHTQIGYVVLTALGAAVALIIYLMATLGFNWIALAVLIVLIICMALFATLEVAIRKDILEVRFGIGIIRKKFLLEHIESCQVLKNPWYYGWGIRLTPHGWLYNVSGSYAVEIKMTNGKKYRIGTDVPNELESVIRQFIDVAKR